VTLHFAKPSVRRLLWSIVVTAAMSCVIVGIALVVGSVHGGHESAVPASAGEYVRWIILCLTLWGPVFVLTAWPYSVPAILAVGTLAACVRRQLAQDIT
jgi:hypothetical protein